MKQARQVEAELLAEIAADQLDAATLDAFYAHLRRHGTRG